MNSKHPPFRAVASKGWMQHCRLSTVLSDLINPVVIMNGIKGTRMWMFNSLNYEYIVFWGPLMRLGTNSSSTRLHQLSFKLFQRYHEKTLFLCVFIMLRQLAKKMLHLNVVHNALQSIISSIFTFRDSEKQSGMHCPTHLFYFSHRWLVVLRWNCARVCII